MKCLHCGSELINKISTAKYCSNACTKAAASNPSTMLFAVKELNPYLWWETFTEANWAERAIKQMPSYTPISKY